MEKYKEKLKIDNRIYGVCALILALFSIAFALAEAESLPLPVPIAGDSHWQSRWRGFCCGASFGIMAMLLFGIYRNIQAVKNEEKLKKQYIQEHDERSVQIWTSARAAGMQAWLIIGLVAVIICGYFSITASLAILCCVFCSSIITALFKVYYSRKF